MPFSSRREYAQTAYKTTTTFDDAAKEVFSRYGRRWKPRTMDINQKYYRSYIKPYFGDMLIADIGKADVNRWFAEMVTIPGAANRGLPVVSVILEQAMLYGYREEGANPCHGIRRYKRKPIERFLSNDEYIRLNSALDVHANRFVNAVAIIRLIALTGARKSEIMTFEWSWISGRRAALPDSKTGPKTLYLCATAEKLLKNHKRKHRRFIFPGISGKKPTASIEDTWKIVKKTANLEGVRLHDLRHSYASFALKCGYDTRIIGRLLGHEGLATTFKYIHTDDDMMHQSLEKLMPTLTDKGDA